MTSKYDYAKKLYHNIAQTSDGIELSECHNLCANKNYFSSLRTKDPQIIFGRRGTGKTTLLKAFTYDVNCANCQYDSLATYILIADMIPKQDEISQIIENGCSVELYTLSKIVYRISEELEIEYEKRRFAMEKSSDESFSRAYVSIQDSVEAYIQQASGATITINRSTNEEENHEYGNKASASLEIKHSPISVILNSVRNHGKSEEKKSSYSIDGSVHHTLDVKNIRNWLREMLLALGIKTYYLCIDEYCELDKLKEPSIQIQVAELIKEVFFKSSLFSVKIASLWNQTNMYSRAGTRRAEGIEIGQDIFRGPDLDLMFILKEIDTLKYFKSFLLNTLNIKDDGEADVNSERSLENLKEYLVGKIFGADGFSQLIVGSQGVSRVFATLVKEYLDLYIRENDGILKLDRIYGIIKDLYITEIHSKIPNYSLCKVINQYIVDKQCRYFLVSCADYYRCRNLIKWLESRDYFRQMPSTLTDRSIRDEYKLFVIHYGNYLDALESASYKNGRKDLTTAAKTERLVPEYSSELLVNPEMYLVAIPEKAEHEVFCSNCNTVFEHENLLLDAICPKCGKKVLGFEEFDDHKDFYY